MRNLLTQAYEERKVRGASEDKKWRKGCRNERDINVTQTRYLRPLEKGIEKYQQSDAALGDM